MVVFRQFSKSQNYSSYHLYQSVFCSHLAIALLAGENLNAIEKIIRRPI
jgi:hypothetical protein